MNVGSYYSRMMVCIVSLGSADVLAKVEQNIEKE